MNVLGEVRVVARADLGGLGAKEGPPSSFTWTPVSAIPALLPWMGILLLLLLPANRCGRAWWVWAPLLALALVEWSVRGLVDAIPSEPLDVFCVAYSSLGFGIAGTWLAAPYLGERSRWVAFGGMLLVLGGVGGLSCAVRGGAEVGLRETIAMLVFFGFSAFLVASSLSLAALPCRRRGGAWRLLLWLVVFLAGGYLVVSLPFVGFAWAMGDGPEWQGLVLAVLSFGGVTFGVLLPFLLLAFLLPFYRERLWALLRLRQAGEGAPPLIAPTA